MSFLACVRPSIRHRCDFSTFFLAYRKKGICSFPHFYLSPKRIPDTRTVKFFPRIATAGTNRSDASNHFVCKHEAEHAFKTNFEMKSTHLFRTLLPTFVNDRNNHKQKATICKSKIHAGSRKKTQ